ncbi:hypothetical protein ST47_g9206 [Ascochyta rabiei]|uniref:Uncharacterized protein n=1 Tax=Didymella rabiei TaxID=5454 RepID=A0A162YA52_DIDRA|nr:hypothetical protein ST47_g9206 [Ascochyta rabiei]
MPQRSAVDFMSSGWDGATTVYSGLEQFIRTFGTGYPNIYNYQFDFAVFQHRKTTNVAIRQYFGEFLSHPWPEDNFKC